MQWINWGSESPEQLEQRRRYEEEAREWAIAKMLAEARGKASASTAVTGGGGGSSEQISESTTTTTTAAPETTTTTTTEDPNWVELTFADWTWVDLNIGNRAQVSAWNTALIETADSSFTSVSVNDDLYSVRLYGGSNVTIKDNSLAATNVTSIIDNLGAITGAGLGSFSEAPQLTTISLNQLLTAGVGTFLNCLSLTTVSLPSLSSTGTACFKGCAAVTSFSLPALSTVGDGAFLDCSSVTSFDLTNVTSLGSGANTYGTNADDGVFEGAGSSPNILFGTVPTTATGAFDEDLLTLFNHTAVTINSKSPVWTQTDAGSFDINTKTYTANGIASSSGTPSISVLGFVINTTGYPTTNDTVFNSASVDVGPFDASFSPEWSTTYYVRAYVSSDLGIFYSLNQETFTTPAAP